MMWQQRMTPKPPTKQKIERALKDGAEGHQANDRLVIATTPGLVYEQSEAPPQHFQRLQLCRFRPSNGRPRFPGGDSLPGEIPGSIVAIAFPRRSAPLAAMHAAPGPACNARVWAWHALPGLSAATLAGPIGAKLGRKKHWGPSAPVHGVDRMTVAEYHKERLYGSYFRTQPIAIVPAGRLHLITRS